MVSIRVSQDRFVGAFIAANEENLYFQAGNQICTVASAEIVTKTAGAMSRGGMYEIAFRVRDGECVTWQITKVSDRTCIWQAKP